MKVARGELYPDRLLAINPGTAASSLDGTSTGEPAFGLSATWISTEQRDRASAAGYIVVDPTTVLSAHLSEIIRNFLPDLLTRPQTKEVVDRIAQTSPNLVEEYLTEGVRASLGRAICRQYQTECGELPTIACSPALEERLLGSIVRTDRSSARITALFWRWIPTSAGLASRIARALETAVAQPVLLCTPALRPHLWRLVARALPHIGCFYAMKYRRTSG